jgi:hypothetical protein
MGLDLGIQKRDPEKLIQDPDPGVKKHRIPDPDPQQCMQLGSTFYKLL